MEIESYLFFLEIIFCIITLIKAMLRDYFGTIESFLIVMVILCVINISENKKEAEK